jgi:DNA (cytosine-5)-methyltransferase 1
MKFIDLFHGLGGFHVALRQLGHECVFASDKDKELRALYEKNFGILPAGDIKSIAEVDIPRHDILCAGFPCQPWSKAGKQRGFDCPNGGDLFVDDVLRIIRHHMPSYIVLENVPNLERHDDGRTWKKMKNKMVDVGYDVRHARLSPHTYGVPHNRERMFIVASTRSLDRFCWPVPDSHEVSIRSVLDRNPADARPIPAQVAECINVWQQFIEDFPDDIDLPTFPIWSMEFGATYPFEDMAPSSIGEDELQRYRGSFGQPLSDVARDQRLLALPAYARKVEKSCKFPSWKVNYIRHNRELYAKHKERIDEWLPQILRFPASQQKFEWNVGKSERAILKYVVQVRASGIRVKNTTTAPSLVAMTTTHVPIIGWEQRYMTPKECARLQSLGDLEHLPTIPTRVHTALGNAVNAEVVRLVAESLFAAPIAPRPRAVEVHADDVGNDKNLFSQIEPDFSLIAA